MLPEKKKKKMITKEEKEFKNLNYIDFGTFLFMEVPLLLDFS